MAPVIDSLMTLYGDKFILVKIDGGEQTGTYREMNVDGFPTFIFYKQEKEVLRKQGLVAFEELVKEL